EILGCKGVLGCAIYRLGGGWRRGDKCSLSLSLSLFPLSHFPLFFSTLSLSLHSPSLPPPLSVNILTSVALSQLADCKKVLYMYLLALTGSDILSQRCIISVGFLLQTAMFHREVGSPVVEEWTIKYCTDFLGPHPPAALGQRGGLPGAAVQWIAIVLFLELLSGVSFFWWSDMLPPTSLDPALISRDYNILPLAWLWHLGKSPAMLLTINSVFAILWDPRTLVAIYHLYCTCPQSTRTDGSPGLQPVNMLAMLNTVPLGVTVKGCSAAQDAPANASTSSMSNRTNKCWHRDSTNPTPLPLRKVCL
uniref:G protein-coupled receptor 142 n=1 Tax=Oncorhynchus tshawytscha TaxID=74940 RepID=A0A8C8I6T7_ONCTS